MMTQPSGMFEPVIKGFAAGTQRTVSPRATLDAMLPCCERLGITRIADVTGLDCIGIPVTMVCRPNSRSLAVSQGKGIALDAAKASGLMESIELYHAEHIALPLRYSSYSDLRRTECVADVDTLPLCIGTRFRPDLPLLWIEGSDLMRGDRVFVPFEMVNMSTVSAEPGAGCFVASSNGLASGNHLIEAMIHGICEVVERDAITLFHLRRPDDAAARRIDPRSVDEAACRAILDQYASAGIKVVIWDLTCDSGIPVFQCLIFEEDEDSERNLFAAMGMGSHTTRHVALLRAMTEAAQSRLTLIAGSRDDVFRKEYCLDAGASRFVEHQRALLRTQPPARPFGAVPSADFDSFNQDLDWLADRLAGIGIDRLISVDLTKAELGIPVVRVIIPGLESFDEVPSYAPGRRARSFEAGLE
jgi:ribosomal protein S12 methylthiotransferase accessory factor